MPTYVWCVYKDIAWAITILLGGVYQPQYHQYFGWVNSYAFASVMLCIGVAGAYNVVRQRYWIAMITTAFNWFFLAYIVIAFLHYKDAAWTRNLCDLAIVSWVVIRIQFDSAAQSGCEPRSRKMTALKSSLNIRLNPCD